SAVSEAWVDALGNMINKTAYIEALQHDPIAFGRDIVCVIHASSLCHENFHNTVTTGNQMNWFTDDDGKPIQLPLIELLHNVKTCWDLIYFMINPNLVTSQNALNCFFLSATHKDIADFKLNSLDWQVIQDMEVVLEVSESYQT
ncbi:hypothetical protein PAXRUDRAFT_90218, partial [Paxillus rubicundulus Ve08.2h10]